MIKRNQASIDETVASLLTEHTLSSTSDLLATSPDNGSRSVDIPRYVRVNLLKTTGKQLRLDLKQLSFRKMKNV